jgi:hypothetical protein
MAKSPSSKRDEKHELSRRALIKWSVAAGAALGVSRSKIFDILEGSAGKETAFAAAQHATHRSVHINDGNGGGAWYSLSWPQVAIAMANNPQFAYHKPGMAKLVAGTTNPLASGPDTYWQDLPAARQVTAFMCGTNMTHTNTPTSPLTINGSKLFAAATALQASSNATIPVVTIGNNAQLGQAQGAQTPANVGNAAGISALFNAAASQAGGLLSDPTKKDANLYLAHYNALIQLQRAGTRPGTKAAYTTAQGAAQFLGTNLSTALATTQADLTRYGVDGSTRGNVVAIANTLIVTVKAFKMGLMNCLVMPGMGDDPHGAFTSGDVNTVPAQLKKVFDAFMADLRTTTDDSTGVSLADDTVITFTTDTTKDCTSANGWPDNTKGNSNVMYVYGAGELMTGWFGNIAANGTITGFGPDGKAAAYNGALQANYANAAVLYAIAKRDDRAISQFANGLQISGIFGQPKDT